MSWAFDSTHSRISRGPSWRHPLRSLSCPLLTVSFSFLYPSPLRESSPSGRCPASSVPSPNTWMTALNPGLVCFNSHCRRSTHRVFPSCLLIKVHCLRLFTFPEASTFSVARKRTMASPPCRLSGLPLYSLPLSS